MANKKKNSIEGLRRQIGLTQAELAMQLGVSENTIANWERGSAYKWIRHLRDLCSILNCTLDDLAEEIEADNEIEPNLSTDILSTVKGYCEAKSKGDKKLASQIMGFATKIDNKPMRYWLDKSEQIIRQCQHEPKGIIDCEAVTNTLVMQNLLNQLSNKAPNEMKYEKFCSLVRKSELSRKFLERYIKFRSEAFSRTLIFQNFYLSIYVIGWKPGQYVCMHHHGSSLDAIQVIEGIMEHSMLPPEESEKQRIPTENDYPDGFLDIPSQLHTKGEWTFIDRRHAHQIRNYSGNENLVTLHFRFGSPPDDNKWVPPAKEQLKLVWEQVRRCSVSIIDSRL